MAEHPLQWRVHTETIRTDRIFNSDTTTTTFPSAFQSYKPSQSKIFPFQTNKKSGKPQNSETTHYGRLPNSLTDVSGFLIESVKSMFQTIDDSYDPPYADCTPPSVDDSVGEHHTTAPTVDTEHIVSLCPDMD